jgi:hypothetical protein
MSRVRRRRRSSRGLIGSFVLGQLPAPMRFALESRMHGVLMVILMSAFIGTGLISIHWEEGGPSVEFSEQRAKELGGHVVQHVRQAPLFSPSEAPGAATDDDLEDELAELALLRWIQQLHSRPTARPLGDAPAEHFSETESWEDRKIRHMGPRLSSSPSAPTMDPPDSSHWQSPGSVW